MGVDSHDMNANGGGDGGENEYSTYVDDRYGKEEVLANPSDHMNHPANNWYHTFMTSSSSFVLLACVAAVSIGCVAINHLQLLLSLSVLLFMVGGGTVLSGSGNIDILSIRGGSFRRTVDMGVLGGGCPMTKWSFSFIEPSVPQCFEIYYEDEDQMEYELCWAQFHDHYGKETLSMKASCTNREYPVVTAKGVPPATNPTRACFSKTSHSK